MKPHRHTLGGPEHLGRLGAWSHTDEKPLGARPGMSDRLVAPVVLHLPVNALRRVSQGKLPQRDEVPLAKEALPSPLGLFGQIDLSLLKPLEELVRREIHKL